MSKRAPEDLPQVREDGVAIGTIDNERVDLGLVLFHDVDESRDPRRWPNVRRVEEPLGIGHGLSPGPTIAIRLAHERSERPCPVKRSSYDWWAMN